MFEMLRLLTQERGIYVDEDLEQDEEIKYSAVRRDTDTSKLKSFMNVPSSAHPFDPLTRPGSIDTKDLQVFSSTILWK
jgi:hypothetical protein